MLDVFKDMEECFWPSEDWESLSLNESWRVRVASAQVFSIVKNRQISHYERVLAFLENTHTLLPILVPAIKHMKITFGLKTMVIMWMLREGAGPVNVVQKINKYFPRKLPQYQVHCRKHEMFIMRQNQLDFRTFAQSLIMDKQKLEDYIQNHLEEQYGDHYAQKTEERLLKYLQELDKALPKITYIDEIMRKKSPLKEAEKALLDLITDDSKTIATTLKTLLRCDATFCESLHELELSSRRSNYIAPESHVCLGVSTVQTAAEKSAEAVAHVESTIMSDVDGAGQDQAVAACTDRCKLIEETDTMAVEKSCPKRGAHVVKIPPHFCSKHQRWVRNILCECPGESSEEQPPQDSEISPPLFTSTSSSSDLTPDLTLPPDHRQSPSASDQLQEAKDPEVVDNAVFIPGKAKTTVTVCPLKISPTSNDLPKCSNQDSSSTTSSRFNPFHQTDTSPTPFISKLSRRFKLGQKYPQSKKDAIKNVGNSPQTGLEIIDAASHSAHGTSGIDIAVSTSHFTDHMAVSTGSNIFSSSHMQPRVFLKQMSREECLKATKGRAHPRQCDDIVIKEQSDPEISFDVNSLYSSSSSAEEDSDIDYKPHKNTLRRWYLGY